MEFVYGYGIISLLVYFIIANSEFVLEQCSIKDKDEWTFQFACMFWGVLWPVYLVIFIVGIIRGFIKGFTNG